jgi:hypothetical protein
MRGAACRYVLEQRPVRSLATSEPVTNALTIRSAASDTIFLQRLETLIGAGPFLIRAIENVFDRWRQRSG